MRARHRELSPDNPFQSKNIPPKQHLEPELILDKPGKIDLKKYEG